MSDPEKKKSGTLIRELMKIKMMLTKARSHAIESTQMLILRLQKGNL